MTFALKPKCLLFDTQDSNEWFKYVYILRKQLFINAIMNVCTATRNNAAWYYVQLSQMDSKHMFSLCSLNYNKIYFKA